MVYVRSFIYSCIAMSAFGEVPRLKGRLPSTLPKLMRSNVEGTWAYDTMSRRVVKDILSRIVDDNSDELTRPTSPLRSECLLQLNDLKSSLEAGTSGYLRGLSDTGPDLLAWDKILSGLKEDERNWLNAPWVISEFYLYRRVVEAFRYFETGYDMFVQQKAQGLIEALPSINEIATRLPALLKSDKSAALEVAVQTSLWGNKMDLSLWPAANTGTLAMENRVSTNTASSGSSTAVETRVSADVGEAGKISFGATLEAGRKYILDDHTATIVQLLEKAATGKGEVGIVVDNAGYELFSDMLLGHCLLELGVAKRITFHTKGHPTFVSDATNDDCMETIEYLSSSSCAATVTLANQLRAHVESDKFVFQNDLFWCQPTPFWDMPLPIEEKMNRCDVVFVKGDANYRRLLGEREWPLDTKASDILSYWPVPVCALRTFKAEIGCGITPSKQQETQQADSKWMVSGRWGVVQVGGGGL